VTKPHAPGQACPEVPSPGTEPDPGTNPTGLSQDTEARTGLTARGLGSSDCVSGSPYTHTTA